MAETQDNRSFAAALWDQFPVVVGREKESRVFCTNVATYFAKRAELEKEYAAKLDKLTKASQDVEFQGHINASWKAIHGQAVAQAKFHSALGEKMEETMRKVIVDRLEESRTTTAATASAGLKLIKDLDGMRAELEKAKMHYQTCRQRQVETQTEYDSAAYSGQKESVVLKLGKRLVKETKQAEDADATYKGIVDQVQALEEQMYEASMPQWLHKMELVETERGKMVESVFKNVEELERQRIDHTASMVERAQKALDEGDIHGDLAQFVDTYCTHEQIPSYSVYWPFDMETKQCKKDGDRSKGFRGVKQLNNSSHDLKGSRKAKEARKKALKDLEVGDEEEEPSMTSSTGGPGPKPIALVVPKAKPKPLCKVRALHNYDAMSDRELSMVQGDVIEVYEKKTDQWWYGELGGRKGMFPVVDWVEDYVEDVKPMSRAKEIEDTTSMIMAANAASPFIPASSSSDLYRDGKKKGKKGKKEKLAYSEDIVLSTPFNFEHVSGFENESQMTPEMQMAKVYEAEKNEKGGFHHFKSRRKDPYAIPKANTASAPLPKPGEAKSPRDPPPSPRAEPEPAPPAERTCVALFDFEAESKFEVDMTTDDVMTIEKEKSGWYYGTNKRTGEYGRYPINYTDADET